MHLSWHGLLPAPLSEARLRRPEIAGACECATIACGHAQHNLAIHMSFFKVTASCLMEIGRFQET
ncbi:hypothetical protein BB934_44185 (plasmid) [Microvirga ossetica]|uniref:Uncharacterized protein n=1 Tax=Microvirga ossetica TaxID=1882682 RepID=A0A1B2EZ22_9HYPH|nr:hypothetical protein BB934_44185 [Microvirga ossetica]